ncbi:hypothetical protein RhiirA4_467323 [Rhizophagus irregularis]|uniref:Uncharacterized protein n=1 Tax=Rhizophagus irregularis TaxID=588596 RepID=A0A2I1GW10_9GLOM|nr:hypothetical protein RhiirA4_467323 [Rhizophagus irregularis]
MSKIQVGHFYESWAQSVIIVTEELGKRAFNPDRIALISKRSAERKQKGRHIKENSRINPSLSKTSQADVIKGKELPSTRQKEPSMYKV